MASKGENKTEKTLVSAKVRHLNRKENVWTIRCKSGPHKRQESIPLGFVLRDLIEVTKNAKENKYILSRGRVQVDGRIIKDHQLPLGLFDVVSLNGLKKEYRIVLDSKGRFDVEETPLEKTKTKFCKIVGKKTVKGNNTRIITNDGRSIDVEAGKYFVGDSIKIEVPSQKILNNFRLEKGNAVYIVSGKHAGEKAKIKEVKSATAKMRKTVVLRNENREFETVAKNVFVLGK